MQNKKVPSTQGAFAALVHLRLSLPRFIFFNSKLSKIKIYISHYSHWFKMFFIKP